MQILNRWTRQAIASGDTLKSAVEKIKSNLRETDLCYADLHGADLCYADLHKADLCNVDLHGADLRNADLREANLREADLSYADLHGADLREANLREARLYNANLRDANLSGAKLNWGSHDLLAEILRRAAGVDVEKRKIAGLSLVSRDWSWERFLDAGDPLAQWALDVMRPWAKDDENAPDALREE